MYMSRNLPMEDMLFGGDMTEEDVKEAIEEALDEIF